MWAYLSLTIAMIMVGSSVVAGKVIANDLPIFLANAAILFVASLVLGPIIWAKRSVLRGLKARTWLTLVLQAVTGVFLFRVFLFYGLRYTGAAESGIITSAAPGVIAVLSGLLFKERLSTRARFAVALTVLGVGVLSFRESPAQEHTENILLGNLLILAAVVCEALFTVFAKAASLQVPALLTATTATVISYSLRPFGAYRRPVRRANST